MCKRVLNVKELHVIKFSISMSAICSKDVRAITDPHAD